MEDFKIFQKVKSAHADGWAGKIIGLASVQREDGRIVPALIIELNEGYYYKGGYVSTLVAHPDNVVTEM